MMKDILESNSKRNSMAKALLVRWKWNDDKTYRILLGLRIGGTAETQYDLKVKYPEQSNEQVTLVVHADQLAGLMLEEKIDKVVELLTDEMWRWDPAHMLNFREKVEKLIK
ncbi:hypothetical protein [Proteiniphilum sp. UBA1028]|uniref:hypothetical protein n=1 Tax=Proteiniphilum sp. UBA1028 TaxID=1947251 RepID=UPI0025F0B870|nr:hypothetical protein [Proteiniphilum sp. UBA1028]